jgi:hypothetical protein
MSMRDDLINASRLHFEAHVEKHRMNVENLLRNPVGIGEHGDLMTTIERELEEMCKYHDLIEVLDCYFEETVG